MNEINRALYLVRGRSFYDPDDPSNVFDPNDFDDGLNPNNPAPVADEFDPDDWDDDDDDEDRAVSGYCPQCGDAHNFPDNSDYCAQRAATSSPMEYAAYDRNGFEYR